MKKNIYCLLLICMLPMCAWAQDSDDEDDYQTEFLYGVNFNTNGGLIGGLVFRYSTTMTEKMRQTFGLEIVNVKHPKEIRTQSSANGSSFVFGKSNYLFVIRPQYGRELLIFRKAPEEGVRISAIAAVGPSLGIIKPYYVIVQPTGSDPIVEQYDPRSPNQTNPQNILGATGLTRFAGTQLGLGFNAKAGLSFEIGGFRTSATGFEVGAMFEAFTKKIVMVPLAENRNVYTSVYLNIFFKSKR